MRRRTHILLVDQRGTGKSNLLSCAAPEGGEDDFDASPEAMQAQAAKCAQALSDKADLRHYTTTDAIADLEAVRKAIGAAQVNLVGGSYGTRVAQQYAARFPAPRPPRARTSWATRAPNSTRCSPGCARSR